MLPGVSPGNVKYNATKLRKKSVEKKEKIRQDKNMNDTQHGKQLIKEKTTM